MSMTSEMYKTNSEYLRRLEDLYTKDYSYVASSLRVLSDLGILRSLLLTPKGELKSHT